MVLIDKLKQQRESMLKYTDIQVTFAEVPDQISLCINISNCPCKCPNCHSAYLAEDIGEELNYESLAKLINNNEGITCVSFMGGDAEPSIINELARFIVETYPGIKVAWYSGRQEISNEIALSNFDFIKVGPYKEELGPLNSRETNQIMYRIVHLGGGKEKLYDITYKFWKHETED